MVTHQYRKIESPKLEEVLVTTSKNTCHSKYVTTLVKLMNQSKSYGSSFEVVTKNAPFLIGVVHQPGSNETEKLVWLEKFEHILSEAYTKWNGVIILAGDLNIDL